MEDYDPQRFESVVRFQCPECAGHVTSTIEVPEPDWADMESSSDMYGDGEYDLACPMCDANYSASVMNAGGQVEVRLLEFPGVNVDADPPFFSPENYYDEEPPDDPYAIFKDAYAAIGKILDEHGSYEDGFSLINRMCFVHYISALEGYLAETLVRGVDDDADARGRLIKADEKLRDMKIPLSDIEREPDIVRRRVRSRLRDFVYHRLVEVDKVYTEIFEIKLFADEKERTRLVEAVRHRHDCVHRSGLDRNAKRNASFAAPYVKNVAVAIEAIVQRVQRALWDKLPFLINPGA